MSEFLLKGLKVQFNLNEHIVRALDGEIIVMISYKYNLHEINFTGVDRMDTANFTQLYIKNV